MKVCTDACILGAWAAKAFHGKEINNIIDVGCGTGLLSLMLAQKVNGLIDAVEIDPGASLQACENIMSSPWKGRITVINLAIQLIATHKKYNLIISNPPFYEGDLRSPLKEVNAAMHDTTLTLATLIDFIKHHLAASGSAIVLLPRSRTKYFEELSNEAGLFINQQLLIRHSSMHEHFRSVLLLSADQKNSVINELTIYDDQKNYTSSFKELMEDYYLNF
ncbi:MAG: methyltransferase [Ferruginibacter sp.]